MGLEPRAAALEPNARVRDALIMALRALVLGWALSALFACGSEEHIDATRPDSAGGAGGTAGDRAEGGADASQGGTGEAGVSAGGSTSLVRDASCNFDATAASDGCTAQTVTAAPVPLDIIWIIDQSCSMDQEIAGVRSAINGSFTSVMDQSGIDYRVIMLADDTDPKGVCVDPPLGAASCGQPNPPRFYQVDIRNLSYQSLQNVMDTFASWQAYLRPEAFRVFVEVTDDESQVSHTQFESWLFSGGGRGFFGDATNLGYVFHSICGIRVPALPTEPELSQKCNTAVGPGLNYQRLSIRSGGLRQPICATDYSPIIRAIAGATLDAVSCRFALPAGVDPASLRVEYTPSGGGSMVVFDRVSSASACGSGDGFYFDDACPPTRATLCPASCATVQSDANAVLRWLIGC
jgi:hypothetical protein